jgi:radical SAM superfamily enzyme YgiQ (UPF0313 family)
MYLSSSLKKAGFNVIVEDITDKEIDQSVEKVKDLDPLFVGVSATFGAFSKSFIEYARKVKQTDNIPVVFGGIHVTSVPELCLKTGYVDYVCLGEGERTVQELAIAIRDSGSTDIEGVCYKEGDELVINPARPMEADIDNFDIDWECCDLNDYIDLDVTTGKRTFKSYRTSRGCPFQCTFCYNTYFTKQRFRPHSVSYVLKDMRMLKEKYKIDIIQFTDDNFFANKKRAYEILKGMKEIGIVATNLDVRATDVDEELMTTLSECGCDSIFIGLESENERVLNYMKKKIKKEDFENALRIADKYNVTVTAQMIIGIPTHTKQEILDTIKYTLHILRNYPNCDLISFPYLPLPGTVMFHDAVEQGYIPPENLEEYDGFGNPTGYLKKSSSSMSWLYWATKQDKEKLRLIAPISTHALFVRPVNGDRFPIRTVKRLLFRIACFRLKHLFFTGKLDCHFSAALRKLWASRLERGII